MNEVDEQRVFELEQQGAELLVKNALLFLDMLGLIERERGGLTKALRGAEVVELRVSLKRGGEHQTIDLIGVDTMGGETPLRQVTMKPIDRPH